MFKVNLHKIITTLVVPVRLKLAIELLEHAIPIWTGFTGHPIQYTDSVVGIDHQIDSNLIPLAIDRLKKLAKRADFDAKTVLTQELQKLYDEIREPVVASEDTDLELPPHVEFVLYSVSNLLEFVTQSTSKNMNEELIYISISQAIAAIMRADILTDSELNAIIYSANDKSAVQRFSAYILDRFGK